MIRDRCDIHRESESVDVRVRERAREGEREREEGGDDGTRAVPTASGGSRVRWRGEAKGIKKRM
jgi:hypothetical protein